VFSKQPQLTPIYIDALAGAGRVIAKRDLEFYLSPAAAATRLNPGFFHHYLIDVDKQKADELRDLIGENDTVDIVPGDCNKVVLEQLIPLLKRHRSYRALVFLDPYKLELEWELVRELGYTGQVDMFLNFPEMHMNRAVLLRNGGTVPTSQMEVMDTWWGDRTWFDDIYKSAEQQSMFEGDVGYNKAAAHAVVRSYQKRLATAGGFEFVPDPVPMLNSKGSPIYWLFFASNHPVASRIATDIFNSYRRKAN
jgi:three-Cys-motif partner protein